MKLNRKVEFALQFASSLHEDQGQRYGDAPYSIHLQEVVNNLLNWGIVDKDILCAGYLHDLVEDCFKDDRTAGLILVSTLFGDKVTTLVEAVTDEPGANRKERKAKTYPKIRTKPGAVLVKLADRYANVAHSIAAQNFPMFKMYQKEQPEFAQALHTIGENDDVWSQLAALFVQGQDAFDNRPKRVIAREL